MNRLARHLLPVLLVVAMPGRVLAVGPHVVINDPYDICQIGADPSLPQAGTPTSMPLTTSDGEAGFESKCGVEDVVYFGAGLSQYFAAHAAARAIMVGKVGVLRGYGYALAESYPDAYGPPFVQATNILSASATAGGSSFFVDVVTPPPTAAAPNPGDATELVLTPVLDVDCAHYTNAFMLASISVSFWDPAQYADTSTDFVDPGFIFSTGRRASGSVCPVSFDPPFTVSGLQVGHPVVMRVFFTVVPTMQIGASQQNFGSYYSEVSALGTATALLTDADGNPVTGASGHAYVAVAPLPDLTVPTTTTTMLPPPTTTTTLPGCGGMCGDGSVEASCGEACDCPPTADPVVSAFGCSGAAIVPAQPACVVCRGCQLVSFCAPSTTTTTIASTTTLPGGSTTSTTFSPTTTTTVPSACAGLVGLGRGRCELTAVLGGPLCGDDVVPTPVDRALRAKLGAANAALGSIATASARRAKKLRKVALHDLRAAFTRAAKAAKAKTGGRRISASCDATLAALIREVTQDVAGP